MRLQKNTQKETHKNVSQKLSTMMRLTKISLTKIIHKNLTHKSFVKKVSQKLSTKMRLTKNQKNETHQKSTKNKTHSQKNPQKIRLTKNPQKTVSQK